MLAVAAMAAANCYGAPALAGHHANVIVSAKASDQLGGQHDHGHGDHAAHAHDSAPAGHSGPQGADGSDASSVCCTSMTCAAVGIVASQGDASVPLRALPGSLSLDDAVRTAATGILDPPPRTR